MILSRSTMWSPLASVIAFGLLGSMFFTLIVIPVLFVVVKTKKVSRPAVAAAASIAFLLALATPSHAQQSGVPNDRLSSSGSEQRSIALDEALQLAIKKNSAVRIAEQKAREADAEVVQAKANYFPVVTNETNAIHVGETQALSIPAGSLGTYSSTGPIPSTNVTLAQGEQNSVLSQTTLVQPISQLFFKIHAGVRGAEAEARMAHEDLNRARNEVSLDVKRLYYQLLSTQERKHAAELRMQAGEEHMKEDEHASESGVVLRVKALESEAQVAEARHTLGSLEDQIADLTNSFNDLVGLPLPTNTELIEPPAELSETEVAAVSPIAALDPLPADPEAEAMAHNPEFLSAQQALTKAHAGLKEAKAEYIPDISIVAQHAYQNGVPLLPQSNGAIGVRVDWTISEFGKRIGLVRERKAQLAQAEENLLSTERKVRMDVQSETRKVHRSETGLEAARQGVAARTELVRITNDEVVAKTANETALKDAQAQLADAKAQLFEAEMQRVIARAELVRTEGRQ